MMSIWISFIWTMEWWGQVNARRSSQLKQQLMQVPNPDLCDTSALLLIISSSSFVGTCILWTNLMTSSPLAYRVVKSSRLLAKIAAYLVISIGRLLCLAFLYGWCFLNKISLDWLPTLTTQPSTLYLKTLWQPCLLAQMVRALHWYRRGQIQILASLNFFMISFHNCISCVFHCNDLLCIYLHYCNIIPVRIILVSRSLRAFDFFS